MSRSALNTDLKKDVSSMGALGRRLGFAIAVLLLVWAALAQAARADDFGVESFDGVVTNADGTVDTQAGSHPFIASTTLKVTRKPGPFGGPLPTGALRDVVAELPVGFTGNPTAVLSCTEAQFNLAMCPDGSQVGKFQLVWTQGGPKPLEAMPVPVYNMVRPNGTPGVFAFKLLIGVVHFIAEVRPEDNGITIRIPNISQALPILDNRLTLWGVPADPSHDAERGEGNGRCIDGGTRPCPAHIAPKPFLTLPTACTGPVATIVHVDSWENPGVYGSGQFLSHDTSEPPVPVGTDGCNQLEFEPSITARPTTNVADSPSGLDVDLSVPQNEAPNGLASAHLKDATVTLPPGLVVNPSSANGLDACSPAQIGLLTPVGQAAAHFNGAHASCPDGSKLGTVTVDTPLVDHPLPGTVYLAQQSQNPFNSLLALYLAIDDPQTGVVVKIAGRVEPDPNTGQLTARFEENPQVPFEHLYVNFFGGARGSLRTPTACGTYTTNTVLTPWSTPEGADAFPADSFAVSQGAGGGACVGSESQAPNDPSFTAGTADPTAKAYSPFVLKLARADGSQPVKAIDTTLPKGLTGKLAGIPYCPDAALAAAAGKSGRAEQASPSCPAASRIGTVNVGAGAGPAPLYVNGDAYLAGPYRGAPLSLAIVTPAVAGPFDLGTVVVRTALNVDPVTTQIHAVSDPIPTILQGIPLDIRTIVLKMDRPDFTLNPTSCDPMSVLGSSTSSFGQTVALSSPFQVGDCGKLGFGPKLTLRLKGGTKRGQHPALRAVLTAKPGEANIGAVSVALPHSEFLEQAHIKTICTRVQYAAKQCPRGSIYGYATAYTPLLDKPLRGPVYLRSSSNPLPDLVAALHGQIDVDLAGRIDSVRGGIRNSFEAVPDAPVSKFVLTMRGARKGLLVNSRNICKSVNRATVRMQGQNGDSYGFRPPLVAKCPKQRKKHRRARHHSRTRPHGKG